MSVRWSNYCADGVVRGIDMGYEKHRKKYSGCYRDVMFQKYGRSDKNG